MPDDKGGNYKEYTRGKIKKKKILSLNFGIINKWSTTYRDTPKVLHFDSIPINSG